MRVTQEQHDALMAEARKAGLSLTDMFLSLCLGQQDDGDPMEQPEGKDTWGNVTPKIPKPPKIDKNGSCASCIRKGTSGYFRLTCPYCKVVRTGKAQMESQ